MTIPDNIDVILMGDINARFGSPENELEERHLGAHGEATRNEAGNQAIQFFINTDLVCLNNRDPKFRSSPQYTYHQQGNMGARSIIDVLCVSRGMIRDEYRAAVLT